MNYKEISEELGVGGKPATKSISQVREENGLPRDVIFTPFNEALPTDEVQAAYIQGYRAGYIFGGLKLIQAELTHNDLFESAGLAPVEQIASADVPGKRDNEIAYLKAEKGLYMWDDTEKQWKRILRD